jgi:hypothetical protein
MALEKIVDSYCYLLEKTIRDIDSISQEFENEIVNNNATKVPREVIFDTVPILKKLREAQREAKISLGVYKKD